MSVHANGCVHVFGTAHHDAEGWTNTAVGDGDEGARDDHNTDTRLGLTRAARRECSADGSRGIPFLTLFWVPGEVGSQSGPGQPRRAVLKTRCKCRCFFLDWAIDWG